MNVRFHSEEDELEFWLKDKPDDWARIVAARAALRALPLIGSSSVQWVDRFALTTIRANAMSWAANNLPSYGFQHAAALAAKDAEESVHQAAYNKDSDHPYAAMRAYAAAGFAADAIAENDAASATFATLIEARAASSSAVSLSAAKEMARSILSDCFWLDEKQRDASAVRILSRRSLWLGTAPKWWLSEWDDLAFKLVEIDANYLIWINWFERRIRGERAAFDIPGDKGRIEDKVILRRLGAATSEDFWGRGHKHANATLKSWLEAARERASKRLDPAVSKAEAQILSNKLQAAASPQATERDGKLDAGPNEEFDQPAYSGDLADLPSAMRSFIKVLLNSLGENASAFMRSSLECYHEELELRGTQPIVGTLKGLAQAISREIWTSQSLVASDDPDDWEMRDEREWGAGMGDLFRTFARYNVVLITHFPLDKEREDLLRQTPIDEMAASGDALTEPVALVTGLVRDLHSQGMATDNILRIIDAHAQYNRDIASLPPPPANLPADYVTAKRRHVLMTAGFYLHLYSVMGSTASLAPAYSALGAIVWNAAQSLLAFVR